MGHAVSGTLHLAGGIFAHVRGEFRMGSEVGRLLEANRLITESFGKFNEEHPGASIGEQLRRPDDMQLSALRASTSALASQMPTPSSCFGILGNRPHSISPGKS